MTNLQLLDFIKQQLQKGSSKEIITSELLGAGWVISDIEEGFKNLENNSINIPIPPSVGEIIQERKENFPVKIKKRMSPKMRRLRNWIFISFCLIAVFLLLILVASIDGNFSFFEISHIITKPSIIFNNLLFVLILFGPFLIILTLFYFLIVFLLKRKKKVFLWFIFLFFITWGIVEIINYREYLSARAEYVISLRNFNFSEKPAGIPAGLGVPRSPVYQLVVVQNFYKIFPSLNPNRGGMDYKPVIYLYPTTIQKTKVQLDYKGKLIADYPAYNYELGGWEVIASPDGKIINSDGKEYSYLFWEGIPDKKINYDLSTGFIVRGEDTIEFLQNTLSKMGLTPKEYNEFIVYWYPKMKDNKYNLVYFAEEEYTETAPLTIDPKPDSILRVFMVFKPLKQKIYIEEQPIKTFIRKGFTVIEWGGTELE
jgi:hypothetical protein